MSSSIASPLSFRPLQEAHFSLLLAWLTAAHVQQWWGSDVRTIEHVVAKYLPRLSDDSLVRCFIVFQAEQPIAYIQAYWLADFPDYSKQLPLADLTGVASLDVFIGEQPLLGKGIGTALVRLFLRDVVFGLMRAESCVVGPAVDNVGAIRAYERAGFSKVAVVSVEGAPTAECIMQAKP
ncbi:MAG: acetyltransferase [Candidatus Obscuribacterales bacterium]|nr:acetyltransferase [Candidatus Obscuribacterales bacterium]